MSQWRKEAGSRLPELRALISAPVVDNPMMLWIELNSEFSKACKNQPVDLDLLRRIWSYGLWCLSHPSDDVSTAAALGFFEHAIDSPSCSGLLSQITTRPVMEGFRQLMEYHYSSGAVSDALDAAFGISKEGSVKTVIKRPRAANRLRGR
jgi:hypothetical protein